MAKPQTAKEYSPKQVAKVRATCLYLATKVGDLLDDLVVVGGLVPSLIIDQTKVSEEHVGTADLDLGLQVALFDDSRYAALTERLRAAGFGPDKAPNGRITRQRWCLAGSPVVTIDFLIAPTLPSDRAGKIRNIEKDFGAFIIPGVALAFRDRVAVSLSDRTIKNEKAVRQLGVCGPGAFVAMKAVALRNRGEAKDAYDLVYV